MILYNVLVLLRRVFCSAPHHKSFNDLQQRTSGKRTEELPLARSATVQDKKKLVVLLIRALLQKVTQIQLDPATGGVSTILATTVASYSRFLLLVSGSRIQICSMSMQYGSPVWVLASKPGCRPMCLAYCELGRGSLFQLQ